MIKLLTRNKKETVFILIFTALLIALCFVPTGFERQIYVNSEGVKAKVLETDDSGVYSTGIIKQGDQKCKLLIQSGAHKGKEVYGINMFIGKMEYDKVFSAGDTAWVLLEMNPEGDITFANMIDHYRAGKELVLILLFAALIIAFSGFTGVRTLMSFAFALLCIWKILIPLMLKGANPLAIALIVGNVLTVATLLLVAGFTKKAYAAIMGAVCCSFATCLLAVLFGKNFNIHGAVMPWSESLIYAGFVNLDLTAIFQAGIYLACSGAILDLAIDISAALDEVRINNPSITRKELVKSGMTIGKSVVGSQTTTLLLAYMGSYLTIMMVYMAQGTPLLSVLNSKTIASEILHTFVGCIGLVLVCPLTSIICGYVYRKDETTTSVS